ncbi:MAG: hypothetical protein AB8B55_09680 [Mariniblastus sp.]
MHLIWFSIIFPLSLFVIWAYPATRIKVIWSLCFLIAILGLVGVIGFDLYFFFAAGGEAKHSGMRALFAIIMNTDIPFFQLAIACGLNWTLSIRYFKQKAQVASTNGL